MPSHLVGMAQNLTVSELSTTLSDSNRRAGGGNLAVPLTALATAAMMFGASSDISKMALTHLSCATDLVDVQKIWSGVKESAPFLEDHLGALLGWMEHPCESDITGLATCFGSLSEMDLYRLASSERLGGDILGPVYTSLRSTSSRSRSGAFYTPGSISALVSSMLTPAPGSSVYEPACGTGSMVIHAARSMRARGDDPASVHWVLNDLDPMAVALTGVNVVVNGLGLNVSLSRGDALAECSS